MLIDKEVSIIKAVNSESIYKPTVERYSSLMHCIYYMKR